MAREYVDEAESGRIADRPQFREMIEEGSQSWWGQRHRQSAMQMPGGAATL